MVPVPSHPAGEPAAERARFERIFRRLHAHHPDCLEDPWLLRPCRDARGRPVRRPYVWSRRNGPWRRAAVLWVGAAPGNAGGKGAGDMGAHGTRIPFGGDVAGANVDVLLGSIGLTRNDTFIVAALNHLPEAGGGEPSLAEMHAPVGEFPSSIHLLRESVVAVGPRLVIALGNVALRATVAAVSLDGTPARLPGLTRLGHAGLERGRPVAWPAAEPPGHDFEAAWRTAWGDREPPHLLWLMHPSAQNMSPYAGPETRFHSRMLDTREALRHAVRTVLDWTPPARRTRTWPDTGVYALPAWRERVGPRHRELERLWWEKGV